MKSIKTVEIANRKVELMYNQGVYCVHVNNIATPMFYTSVTDASLGFDMVLEAVMAYANQ